MVCWTLPAAPPGPGAGCPAGADALQVTTPPITVQYAFAPVLGSSSNQVRALAAASAAPPWRRRAVARSACSTRPAAPPWRWPAPGTWWSTAAASRSPRPVPTRDNPTPILLASAADTAPTGAAYARSARLVLASSGDLRTGHPLVLGRLLTLSTGSVRVTPARADARSLSLPTAPVLIS